MKMQNVASAVRSTFHSFPGRLALVGGLLASAGSAFAVDDLTTALTAEAATGKPQLYIIGGIILGLCAVGVIIAFARRNTH